MNVEFTAPSGADFDRPGWVYRDVPNMTEPFFNKFVNLVGEENLHWLTFAERTWPNGETTFRGQLLVSPEGLQRVAQYNELKND
jgi:hypothetical protein